MVLKAVNIISRTTSSLPFSTTCCESAHLHSTGESNGTKKKIFISLLLPKKIIFGLWASHIVYMSVSQRMLPITWWITWPPAPIPWISDLEQRLGGCSITLLKQIIKQDTEGHEQELPVSH